MSNSQEEVIKDMEDLRGNIGGAEQHPGYGGGSIYGTTGNHMHTVELV